MRIRAAIAVPAASAAVAALLLTAPPGQAAARAPRTSPCAQGELTVRATPVPGRPTVVRVSVTNHSGRACAIDRVPLVTFGGLDGAALPVPANGTGRLRLAAGSTVHADVRTIVRPGDPQARRAASVTVGDWAGRWGRVFSPARLGAGTKVSVWEPVTTWWQPSAAAADRALGLRAGGRPTPASPSPTSPSPSPSPTKASPTSPSPSPTRPSPTATSPSPTRPSPTTTSPSPTSPSPTTTSPSPSSPSPTAATPSPS